MSFISTGVDALDKATGGFLKGSSILVRGAPGTGKTVFSTQFLVKGVKLGEPGVYTTFRAQSLLLREPFQAFRGGS